MRKLPTRWNPKTMTKSRTDPRIIYDRGRKLDDSVAVKGPGWVRVLVGIKGNPSRFSIQETISHELAHAKTRWGLVDYEPAKGEHKGKLKAHRDASARSELRAYYYERQRSTPKTWNRVLPIRIDSFIHYLSWLTKKQRQEKSLRDLAKRALAPKVGGGNGTAIRRAQQKLALWWR